MIPCSRESIEHRTHTQQRHICNLFLQRHSAVDEMNGWMDQDARMVVATAWLARDISCSIQTKPPSDPTNQPRQVQKSTSGGNHTTRDQATAFSGPQDRAYVRCNSQQQSFPICRHISVLTLLHPAPLPLSLQCAADSPTRPRLYVPPNSCRGNRRRASVSWWVGRRDKIVSRDLADTTTSVFGTSGDVAL